VLAITARYYLAILVLLKLDGCRFTTGLVLYPVTFTTHPFRLIWLVKLAVTAAFGCSPSTISCCQGPRLTADTLLLTPSSPTVPDHWDSTQHINKIVPLRDSIVHANLPAATMCLVSRARPFFPVLVGVAGSAAAFPATPTNTGEKGSGSRDYHVP